MKVVLVVKQWRDSNLQNAKRDDVADGLFVEGSYFEGKIFLEPEDERDLRKALGEGYYLEAIINKP